MSLCRYLPTPSDRMGIIWSLLTIDDSIVLEYGPAGTTHYSMGLFGRLGVDQQQKLFTTHMSEDDVVMGDVSRLEHAIEEVDANYKPKVIFVIASSISAVIGTDLKGVCNYMQDKVSAKLVAFTQGGFRGDYSVGLCETYKLLVSDLVETPEEVQQPTYNIIGSSMGMYRTKSDVLEIERLMKEAYGLEQGAVLCWDTTVDAISKMASAKINLVLSYEGLAAAKLMEEQFNVPYIYGVPYGYNGTLQWLESIGKVIEQSMDSRFISAIKDSIAEKAYYKMYGTMLQDKPTAYIYSDYDRLLGLSTFLGELCVEVKHKVCCHTLRNIEDVDQKVQYIPNEGERIKLLNGLEYTFVLADDISNTIVGSTNTVLCVTAPFINRMQIATHLPLVGLRGADFIREYFEEYLRSLR